MTPNSTPLSVLVVDDSRDTADSLALLLRAHGLVARTAYSAVDVGRIISRGFRPLAVLMDIGLAGVDGYAVALAVCAGLGYRPLLVAITGHQGLEARSDREGFDLHFLKPLDPAVLLKTLDIFARQQPRAEVAADDAGSAPAD
jgi:DNA-binding response OmpR family regulator